MNRLAGSNPAPSATHDVVKPASAPVKLDDAELRPALYPLVGAGRLPQWALCMPQWAEEEKQQKSQKMPSIAIEHRYAIKDECIHPSSIAHIGLVTAETRGALQASQSGIDRGRRTVSHPFERFVTHSREDPLQMSIKNKAYIVGIYEHPTRKAEDKSLAQLHAESAKGAIEDAGLSKSDIDGY